MKTEGEEKSSGTVAPLAPPPKPSQQDQTQPTQTPDYFGGSHGNAHFSLEPNPFEQSFGNPSSAETPGKAGGLPSVASLTSPAAGGTPGGWQNSLRSGPLSPAMLQGPVNANSGYFDGEFRNNYPTPNESSLRTGLTPGGGGSMFPAPSPNTAAIFNLGGGVTPGTAEFQRAAHAARQKSDNPTATQNGNNANGQSMPKQEYQPAQQQGRTNPFTANQQEHEAVNSLYMLAQPNTRGDASNANQFAPSNQQQINQNLANMNIQQRLNAERQDQQPMHSRNNGSIDMGNGQDEEGDGDEGKPSTRSKGKKGSASKASQATNGRRKAEETPTKAPPKKRSRGNTGSAQSLGEDSDEDEDDDMGDDNQLNANGKKMTDEEKRKNFLERNRVAALKCRQRKKQWLANLQTKVEIFTTENDALTQQCGQLREEVINLKTLLLAHKDCPVSHSQGIGGQAMAQFMGNIDPQAGQGPYGMISQGNMHMGHMQGQAQGMQQGMQPSQGVQRR